MKHEPKDWCAYFRDLGSRSIPKFIIEHFKRKGIENPTTEDVLTITEGESLNSWLSMHSVFEFQRFQEITRNGKTRTQ